MNAKEWERPIGGAMLRRATGPGGPLRHCVLAAKQAELAPRVVWGEVDGEIRLGAMGACPLTAPDWRPAEFPEPPVYSDAVDGLVIVAADGMAGSETAQTYPWRYGIVRRALLALVRGD